MANCMPVEKISINCSLKKRSHMFQSSKSPIRFFALYAVHYITEILLQKHANALLIVFYKINDLSMSKTQYKRGKIIALPQKMRLSRIFKKLNVYKPCLLIVDINGTDLTVIGNRQSIWCIAKYFFCAQIKSLFTMYFK